VLLVSLQNSDNVKEKGKAGRQIRQISMATRSSLSSAVAIINAREKY
jgi:hypothetical protein